MKRCKEGINTTIAAVEDIPPFRHRTHWSFVPCSTMGLKPMTPMNILFETLVYASLMHANSAPIGLPMATPTDTTTISSVDKIHGN